MTVKLLNRQWNVGIDSGKCCSRGYEYEDATATMEIQDKCSTFWGHFLLDETVCKCQIG